MKMFRFSDCELDSSQFANSFVQIFTDLMEAAEGWVADDSEGRTLDVANWPAVRKPWKCEIRSVHSLVCGAVSISSEAMPGVSSFGTEKASSYQNVFWSCNICNKYRY